MSQSQKPATPGAASTAKLSETWAKDCVVFNGENGPIIASGNSFGSDVSKIKAKLCSLNFLDTTPSHALRIDIPLGKDNEDRGFGQVYQVCGSDRILPVEYRTITLKFPAGHDKWDFEQAPPELLSRFPHRDDKKCCLVTINLRERATIVGCGMPFANASAPELEDWYKNNRPSVGDVTFRDFVQQTTFHILVASPENVVEKVFDPARLGKPFSHSYGTNLDWDVKRLAQLWYKTLRAKPYHATFQFDDVDTMLGVNTQIHIQDDLWVELDARRLRERQWRSYCVPHETEKDAYFAIIMRGIDLVAEFETSWDRMLSNPLELLFWRKSPVAAAIGTAAEMPTVGAKGEEPLSTWTAKVMSWPSNIPEVKDHLLGDTDLVIKIWRPDHSHSGSEMPDYVSLNFKEILVETERKFRAITTLHPSATKTHSCVPDDQSNDMQALHRAVMMGTGFHEYMSDQGLAETLAATSLEMQEQIQVRQWRDLPVVNFLSGLDPELVDSLCEEALPEDRARFMAYLSERLLGIGIITGGPGFGKTTIMATAALAMHFSLGSIACSGPSHVAITNLAERLDRTSISVSQRFNNRKNPQDASRVRQSFVLRVFKLENEYKAFLVLLQNPSSGDKAVPDIRGEPVKWTFTLSLAYWLLVLLNSPATTRRLALDDSLALHAIQRDLDVCEDFRFVRELCADRIDYSSCPRPSKDTVLKVFKRLINAADILCATPRIFDSEVHVMEWKTGKARAVVFDEAASMSRGDIIQVWGNDLLPCLLGGDPKQLPPTVMTNDETTIEGLAYHQLIHDAKVSGLEFLQVSGIPVYRLRKQLRMAMSLWDMAGGIIYADQPIVYGDHCDIDLPEFEIGRRLEDFIQSQYPDVHKAAENTFCPLFIHCDGTRVFTNPVTHSKKSSDQVTVALDFASKFVKEKAVDASKVVILAPYFDNAQLIDRRRKNEKYANLAAMRPASTIDGFQGQEADIVIVVMGTRACNPGPGFTKNPRRLNVLLTRQRCGLVIIGDINVAGIIGKSKKEGEHFVCLPGKPRMRKRAKELWKAYKYLHDRGRVATIKVNTPELELEKKRPHEPAETGVGIEGDEGRVVQRLKIAEIN